MSMTEETAMTDHATPATGEFLITKEYRRFAEFCDACRRERYIGLCYGPPGVGKTLSARRYAAWAQVAPALVAMRQAIAVPVLPAETLVNRTVFYTATINNTPRRIDEDLDILFRGF